MASVLRFTWHGRRFSEFSSMGRILTSNKYNATNSKIILQHNPNKSNQIRSVATQNDSIGMENHKVADTLNKLDVDARKESRISLEHVNELFYHLKKADKMAPDGRRAKLAHVIWTALEENGCVFDVSHYNLLLNVHLKNEYNFNPTDFLAKMEANKVAPNRVTCQRLISRYCQLGDVEGAGRILEFMKKKGFTVNEHVYNALIKGHVRTNNIEAAKEVFDLMRNSKIKISASSYAPLLYTYAEKGDIENIRQIIDEIMKDTSLDLATKHYVGVICSLAKNGHFQHVEEFNSSEETLVVSKLINCGREEVAMRLLGHLPRIVRVDSYTSVLTRHYFIHQLVGLDRPIEKIVEICKDMKTSGMNTQAFHKATEAALEFGKIDLALKLIKVMKEEDLPVHTRYFWPILTNSKKHNESELYDIFYSMVVYGCPANYSMFVYFYCLINTDDYKIVITKLRDFGYTLDAIVSPLVEFYVTEKKLEKACSLLNEYPTNTNVNSLIRRMAVICKRTNDVKTTVQLLKRIKEVTDWDMMDRIDIVGQFLLTYSRIEKSARKTQVLAKEILQNRLQISPEMGDLVRRILQLDEQDSLTSTLQTLSSSAIPFSTDDVVRNSCITVYNFIPKKLEDMTQQKAKDDRWIKKQAMYVLVRSENKFERQTQGRKFWLRLFCYIADCEMLARNGYPKEELNEISIAINITKVFSYFCDKVQNQRRNVPNTICHVKIMKSAIAELEDEDTEWEAAKAEFEAELEALKDRWAIELVEDLKAAIAELKIEDVELKAENAELKAEYAELEAEKVNLEDEPPERYYTDWGSDDESDWETEDNRLEGVPLKAEFEFNWNDENYYRTVDIMEDILYVSKKINRKMELREFWIDHLNRDDYFRSDLFEILGENGYPDEELNTISIATNMAKVFSFLIRIMKRNQLYNPYTNDF